ncbi:hypothetical protein JCM18382A_50030 [Bradyrhizobium sp. 17-4]|jgi:hypothetical protein
MGFLVLDFVHSDGIARRILERDESLDLAERAFVGPAGMDGMAERI